MKKCSKFLAGLLALTLAISAFTAPVEVQAATKTTTYTYDQKNGVAYQTAIRAVEHSATNYSTSVYLLHEGDYITGLKSSSSNLVVKATRKTKAGEGGAIIPAVKGLAEGAGLKVSQSIGVFAKKKGTYTISFTVKNAANKKVCSKKIKVYVTDIESPTASFSYAGKKAEDGMNMYAILTKKGSGKLSVKASPTYKVKSIAIATTMNEKNEPVYKTVKNGAKITLGTQTNYQTVTSTYDGSGSYGSVYKAAHGRNYDLIYPTTIVKITYYDTKLKITTEYLRYIIYQNK